MITRFEMKDCDQGGTCSVIALLLFAILICCDLMRTGFRIERAGCMNGRGIYISCGRLLIILSAIDESHPSVWCVNPSRNYFSIGLWGSYEEETVGGRAHIWKAPWARWVPLKRRMRLISKRCYTLGILLYD
jgi:hypothetical protein